MSIPPLPPPGVYPFSCSITPGFAEILDQLRCTLVISTYQAGKVIFMGINDKGQLVQLPRSFDKAMGIALYENKMAVACRDEVVVLSATPDMALKYPKGPGIYDSLYMPRATYYTGRVDLHDLEWGSEGLWGVNTSFSCLCLIDEDYSFKPRWQPHFIRELEHDDLCHLNGMAMEQGQPRYVTLLGETTTRRGWIEQITSGGCLMDVASNSIILRGLGMPHSPRIYDGKLYLLLSATGELVQVDPHRGTYEVICALGTFIRGLTRMGDYLFIGRSALRRSSSSFEKLKALPIGKKSETAGISILHLPSAKVVGELTYQNSVEEIYDIQVIPGLRRPGILNTEGDMFRRGLSIPGQSYWSHEWDDAPHSTEASSL